MFFVDGVDVDWEFPGGLGADADKGNPAVDGANYFDLIKEMREALDELGEPCDKHYELSNAIGVGPT